VPAPRLLTRSAVVDRLRAAGCVYAEDEAELLLAGATTPGALTTMLDQRVAGLPLEHVLGWVEFFGRRWVVDPGVFVPRRRTELLVRQAAALAAPGSVVVDLCCGSGAVGAALATVVARAQVHASDVDPAAVRCARANLLGVKGRVYQGDLYEPLPAALRGRVDILLANAPYVPTGSIALMPPEARLHEPAVALDGGADGLDVQRRVIAEAPQWLAPGGHLLVETGRHQAARTAEAFFHNGLHPQVTRCDELDATVAYGTSPASRRSHRLRPRGGRPG